MKKEIAWTLSTGKQATVTVELRTEVTLNADGHKVTVPCCDMTIYAEVEDIGVVGWGAPKSAQTAAAKIGKLGISAEKLAKINAAIAEIEATPEWKRKLEGQKQAAKDSAEYEKHRAKMAKVMGY